MVHHIVGEHRGDDLAAQAVLVEQLPTALYEPRWEVGLEGGTQPWLVGQGRGGDLVAEVALRGRQQDRQLGAGESGTDLVPLLHLVTRWQGLELAVKLSDRLQVQHEPLICVPGARTRQRLV